MNLKFLFLVILIFTLTVPLMNIQIFSIAFAQNSDKSFKGNEAPFIQPPKSERTPKAPPLYAVSLKDRYAVGLEDPDKKEEKRKTGIGFLL